MSNYYEILGVPKNAGADEIKRAYRRLAHKYHPDKQGGDEKKFKEINEAYQILRDDRKRAQYDQFGSAFNFGGKGGFSGFSTGGGSSSGWDFKNFSGAQGFDFSDIFSEFFGGGRSSAKAKDRGMDIHIDMILSLEEAYAGTSKEFSIRKYIVCDHCRGNKAEPGSKINICKKCKGSGEVRVEQKTFLGSFARIVDCGECAGEGAVPEKKCSKCRGVGRVHGTEKIRIDIPAGIDTGGIITLKSKGEAGATGVGDLYVEIYVNEHPVFKRKGNDIYSDIKITLSKAVLGGVEGASTLEGVRDVKIPGGSQNNDVIKLQGGGVPRLRGGGSGDHYLRIIVKIPKNISGRTKKIFEELKSEGL